MRTETPHAFRPVARVSKRRAKVSAADTYGYYVYLAVLIGGAIAAILSVNHP